MQSWQQLVAEPLPIIISILPKQKPEIIRIEQTDPGFEHRKLNSEPALLAVIMCCLLV